MQAQRRTIARQATVAVALALGYAVVGSLALRMARDTGLASPVWPAAGLAFAVVFVRGAWVLPGVAVGSVLVNFPALLSGESPSALLVSIAIGIGAALQAEVGAVAVRRAVGRHPTLTHGREILLFALLAGPVACLVNPTIGVTVQLMGEVIAPPQAVLVWLTWWVGDSIGVLVFAPLTLMLLPSQADVWTGRRWKVAVPSLVFTGITVVAFAQSSALKHSQIDLRLEQRVADASADLRQNLGRDAEFLSSVRSMFDASEFVSRTEFDQFTRASLERLGGVQAVSWDAVVPRNSLRAFEVQQRTEQGQPGFRVWERAPDGSAQPVGDRAEYVVITYIEPRARNAAALGYDIASDPARATAVAAARDLGTAVATPAVPLVSDADGQKGVLELLPVYAGGGVPSSVEQRRERIIGYVIGLYRMKDTLAQTFADSSWDGVSLELVDVTDDGDPQVLAVRDPVAEPGAAAPELAMVDPVTQRISVGGRTWSLELRPTADYYASLSSTNDAGLLVGGMLVCGLLEALLLLLTGTERRFRRQAEESGHQASHDPLTDLLNRRGFLVRLEAAREQAREDGSSHVLLFLDLDNFKDVNDAAGHRAGDALLVGLAQRMRRQVRGRDAVARLGGDEFAVLLLDCSLERGESIAANLLRAVDGYRMEWDGQEHSVGVSVGVVAISGPDPADVHDLLQSADRACYEAKAAGKGRVQVGVAAPAAGAPSSVPTTR